MKKATAKKKSVPKKKTAVLNNAVPAVAEKLNPVKPKPKLEVQKKSAFGHFLSRQSGTIDKFILEGKFTVDQITAKIEKQFGKVGQGRVLGHIKHLKIDKQIKIAVAEKTGIIRCAEGTNG